MDRILGTRLDSKAGSTTVSSLESVHFKLLYVSASWCPPCRLFVPELIEFYQEANSSEKRLEVVWVSRDRTEEDYRDLLDGMPWLAVPYEKGRISNILAHYNIEGIPKVLLLDEFGNIVHDECRQDIKEKGINCLEEWDNLLG